MARKNAKSNTNRSRGRSTLDQHKRVKKTLVPPLLTLPQLSVTSWSNNRLPEMLWAGLVISTIPRNVVLPLFREIAALGLRYRDSETSIGWSLSHSDIPKLPDEFFRQLIKLITDRPLGYAALRPLLLFDELPGRERWERLLGVRPQDDDWQTLARAVLNVLDHQSQEATDVRWLTLLFQMALGRLYLPAEEEEFGKEIFDYPNRGDMGAVRAGIRAAEGALTSLVTADDSWSKSFWKECLDKTSCIYGGEADQSVATYDRRNAVNSVLSVHDELIGHWFGTLETTDMDAKHDASFGIGFYALSLLLESIPVPNSSGIVGRALLRILVECRITLAYLRHVGTSDLWNKFRAFGTGQAKLALLKLDEISGSGPNYADPSVLDTLSNEDLSQEFVQIELGNWTGLDLRKMAEASSTKDDYDAYYGWPSTYMHGHWAAIRDSSMTLCHNPLHRLHRIPLRSHRRLEDTVPDAIRIVNLILDEISMLYPPFESRVAVIDRSTSDQASPTVEPTQGLVDETHDGSAMFPGTEVPVDAFRAYLGEGRWLDGFLNEHPEVRSEDLQSYMARVSSDFISRVKPSRE